MIRPVFTEIVLFLLPFVLYARVSVGDQGRRAASGLLAAVAHRLAGRSPRSR